jgi:hypothetical protein
MPNNIVINVASGNTANIATNEVGGAQYQVFKVAYGNTSSASIVSSTSPLPVVLSTGVTANIVNFTNPVIVVGNSAGDAVFVQGTINVRGVTGAPLAITGGIPRSYTRDSMAVYGFGGNTWIPATLVSSGGAAIGVSGNALRVSVQDITITASINPVIYVENFGATGALRVQGFTGAYPLNVSVTGTAGINDTNIVNGITAIYGKVDDIYDALSVFGLVRPTGATYGRFTVTNVSATQLSAGFTCSAGVNLKAASYNTDIVYIGNSALTTNGYELDPGEQLFLDVGNANSVYLRAKSSSQVISFTAS